MTDRRTAVWFGVFAVVVFASGLAAGVLLDRVLVPRGPAFPFARAMRGPDPGRLTARLTSELSLDAAQQSRVRAILESRRGQVRRMHQDLRADARKRFQAEQAALRDELRTVLTPEQQAKLDTLLKQGPERLWPGPGRFLGSPSEEAPGK